MIHPTVPVLKNLISKIEAAGLEENKRRLPTIQETLQLSIHHMGGQENFEAFLDALCQLEERDGYRTINEFRAVDGLRPLPLVEEEAMKHPKLFSHTIPHTGGSLSPYDLWFATHDGKPHKDGCPEWKLVHAVRRKHVLGHWGFSVEVKYLDQCQCGAYRAWGTERSYRAQWYHRLLADLGFMGKH